jgi:fatty acid desaturase
MNTATPRVLSGAEVRALSARSNWLGALQLGTHLAMIALAGWLVAVSGPWTIVPAIVLLGVAQSALFAPVHETMHLTAFASRRVNAVVGWLAACPSLLNWHFYTVFHLAHHRFTQDPERDPELTPRPPTALDGYLLRILAVNYWRARAKVLVDCWRGDLSAYPYIPAASQRRVIASVRWMSLTVAALAVGSAVLWGWWVPLVFWIVPQIVGQVFLRLYLLTEHTGCDEVPNGLVNTRTTLTTAAVRLLMWNMSYHAEHHLYPSIPFHRLPSAHIAVRDRLKVLQPGYVRWHARYLKDILRRA